MVIVVLFFASRGCIVIQHAYFCSVKRIIAYKSYFEDFLNEIPSKERVKIARSLSLLKEEHRIPRHFIEYVRDGIYEFRVTSGGNEYRIFFIYDGDMIVVLFNAFKKKTRKTPNREIDKAIRLKQEYYEAKRNT